MLLSRGNGAVLMANDQDGQPHESAGTIVESSKAVAVSRLQFERALGRGPFDAARDQAARRQPTARDDDSVELLFLPAEKSIWVLTISVTMMEQGDMVSAVLWAATRVSSTLALSWVITGLGRIGARLTPMVASLRFPVITGRFPVEGEGESEVNVDTPAWSLKSTSKEIVFQDFVAPIVPNTPPRPGPLPGGEREMPCAKRLLTPGFRDRHGRAPHTCPGRDIAKIAQENRLKIWEDS